MTAVPLSVSVAILCVLAVAVWGYLQHRRHHAEGYGFAQVARRPASELETLRAQVVELRRRKDEAYAERNAVIALLAAVLCDNNLATTGGPFDPWKWNLRRGYDEHFKGWGNCLYLEAPDRYRPLGQLNWHFPNEQAWMIDALGLDEHPTGWDKRSRERKYAAIEHWLANGTS